MLYNYYMKNNFFRLSILSVLLLVCATASAQITVVRIDGPKIYLDTSSAKQKIQKGQSFKIILSSEKLINPKTGKNLGNIYHYSAAGQITEVQPLYAIGELTDTQSLAIGQEAVLEDAAPAAPAPQPAQAVAAADNTSSQRPKVTYAPVEQEFISVTQGDVTAPGAGNIITLSSDRQVTVWSRGKQNTLHPELTYTLPSSGEPITLSAVPLKAETVQIFVPIFYPNRQTIATQILENRNGRLEEIGSLGYFVKEMGCGKAKTLWAQKPFVSDKYPGSARQVTYQPEGFSVSKESFSTQRNWLTGLTRYDIEKPGSNNLIYTSPAGTLRIVLQNGKRADSKDLFASSPNRVKYKQEILKFYPSVQAFGPHGNATIAAVENDAKIGILAKMFGQYQSGKIHFMQYQNGHLSVQDTTPLDGVIYDTACSDRAILAAEVLSNGTSRVVEILK